MNDLNIVVAGHVDHGKSTLIGRLLYDVGALPQQVAARFDREGKTANASAFAFITDQLAEEQEDSFTLDTAQAHFRMAGRDYTLIDTPGHREFLKNMVTGTTKADAAILVVDAAEGPLAQTYLHAYLIGMLGIRQMIVVVNKLDRISYDRLRFQHCAQQVFSYLKTIDITPAVVIPASAQYGDQISAPSPRMPWNSVPSLAEALQQLTGLDKDDSGPSRFIVQCAFRQCGRQAILGKVASGSLRHGQTLTFEPTGQHDTVVSVLSGEDEIDAARRGQSVALFLQGDTAVGRGCVGFDEEHTPTVTDHFKARVFWISSRSLERADRIEIVCGTQSRQGRVETIAKVIDPVCLSAEAGATRLSDSQVAEVAIRTDSPMCIDPFDVVPELGRFAIVQGGRTAGGGVTLGQG